MTKDRVQERWKPWIGILPFAFIACAMLNFTVGSTLGLWMATDPTSWGTLASIHGESNPFGWLTMLIYGMTYAVLSVSAELRLSSPILGWVHLVVAEAGVTLISMGIIFGGMWIIDIGYGFQACSPCLFLMNILLALRAKRLGKMSVLSIPETLTLIGRRSDCEKTDRIARRGTDVSGLLFVVGAAWACVSEWISDRVAPGARVLIYDGWLVGTVASVSLHFYPRLVGATRNLTWPFRVYQVVWLASVALMAFAESMGASRVLWFGRLLFGLSLMLLSSTFIYLLVRSFRVQSSSIPLFTLASWSFAYGFAALAGVLLLLGADELSLPVLHSVFLGWMTTLVYGVSYRVLPLFLEIQIEWGRWESVQVIASAVGAALMVAGFTDLGRHVGILMLAVGGTTAWLSFIWFAARSAICFGYRRFRR